MNKYRENIEVYLYDRKELLMSKDQNEQQWSAIIEKICAKYEGTEMGKLIHLKYEMRLPEQQIFERLNVEKTTYYVWRNRLVNEITLQAAYQRLIKPF
jgi:predicted phage-related endonuclease